MESSPSLVLVVSAAALFGSWVGPLVDGRARSALVASPADQPAPRLEIEPLSCRCECQVNGRGIEVY